MKKLIMVAIAVALLLASDAVSHGPLRGAMLGVSLVLSGAVLVHGVVSRRRRGQSWNQALVGDTKLITGSVWWDGALFAGVLVCCGAAVVLLMMHV